MRNNHGRRISLWNKIGTLHFSSAEGGSLAQIIKIPEPPDRAHLCLRATWLFLSDKTVSMASLLTAVRISSSLSHFLTISWSWVFNSAHFWTQIDLIILCLTNVLLSAENNLFAESVIKQEALSSIPPNCFMFWAVLLLFWCS